MKIGLDIPLTFSPLNVFAASSDSVINKVGTEI